MNEVLTRAPKILNYKTYNSIPHLSKSRLAPTVSKMDIKNERKMTDSFPNDQYKLIVQEKMDGTNVCIVRIDGQLRALSRNGYDCASSRQAQQQMFYRYFLNNKRAFEKLLPDEHDRVVGEWCAMAHGTLYENLGFPFWAFDIYRNKRQQSFEETRSDINKLAEEYENFITYPFSITSTDPIQIDKALDLINNHRANSEGVIYRLEVRDRPYLIGKVVKQDKEDGKYYRDFIWNWSDF